MTDKSLVPAEEPQQPAAEQPQELLGTIGTMRVTPDYVYTGSGTLPLAQAHVSYVDQTRTQSKTPTWAIVMTIITVWFAFIGLLFLLAKKETTTGFVSITVRTSDGRGHTENVAIHSPAQRDTVIAHSMWLQNISETAAWKSRQIEN